MTRSDRDVRFTPESGHWVVLSERPLSANSGHPFNISSLVKVSEPWGSRICGFKAALPRQRLRFCAILPNVAVRSYDGALRSSMAVVGGVEISFRHLRGRDGARHT
jgi:hypothetical protein